MELFLGGLAAFIVEMLVLALLLAPRWTLRMSARPFRALATRLRRHRTRRTWPERIAPATSQHA